MSTEFIILLGYAFISNVAVSVVPHEPVVIAAGPALGVGWTTLAATLGTLLAGVVDYVFFGPRLARLPVRASSWSRRLIRGFEKRPFLVLVAVSLTPLPHWPFKVLAFASGYPMTRYLVALGVGRAARYGLLAWAGDALAPPGWAPALFVVAGLVAIFAARASKRKPHNASKATKENSMSEQDAKRTTRSLTAAWEKRNLPRMAAALPGWVTPDHLTGLGIAAAVAVGAGYVLASHSRYWLGLTLLGLVVHWAADSLDGTLARVRKIERERYGYYVDRTADAISTVVIGLGLGLSSYVDMQVALLMTIGYLLLMLYAEICAYTCREFPLSFGLIGPTEARILLGLFTLALGAWTPPTVNIAGIALTWIDLGVLAVSGGLFATFLISRAMLFASRN